MLRATRWSTNYGKQGFWGVSKAIVLTSGGLDSATVLAVAQAAGKTCFSLSIDYGQRHRSELAAAERVAAQYDDVEHRVVTSGSLLSQWFRAYRCLGCGANNTFGGHSGDVCAGEKHHFSVVGFRLGRSAGR